MAPVSLYRLIRRRYPNTAVMVLILAAAIGMLFVRPLHDIGAGLLVAIGVAVVAVAGQHIRRT